MDLIGGNSSEIEIFRCIDLAVEKHNRNFCFLGFLQHRIPACRNHWRDQDCIDALRNEAANGLDLVFLLLLCVGEFQCMAALFSFLLGDAGFGCTPARFRTDLRKADRQ